MADTPNIMEVGIDLGTTNTLAAYTDAAGNIRYLTFDRGSRENPHFLPSVIAWDNRQIIVGQPALDLLPFRPTDVFTAFKEHMGTQDVCTAGTQQMLARDAAAHILREVHRQLERSFRDVSQFRAFVTVPARYHTSAPREDTVRAMQDAGFLVGGTHKLTDEPISAAIAYSTRMPGDSLILVVDFGGGTFDLSLIHAKTGNSEIGAGHFEPVGWGGDRYLGGNDVDSVLVGLMAAKAEAEFGVNLSYPPNSPQYSEQDAAAAAKLRTLAYPLKVQLFDDDPDDAEVYTELYPDRDFSFTLSRSDYLDAVKEITGRMQACLTDLYRKSGISMKDTDKILVVGGMAKELSLQHLLKTLFPEKQTVVPDNSMYLVVRGAAICCGNAQIHVDNKAYSSVGVLIENGQKVDVIIRAGDTIQPDFRIERIYHPLREDQTKMQFRIVEFEGDYSPGCSKALYSHVLLLEVQEQPTGIEKAVRKIASVFRKKAVHVLFRFSEDKILLVTATEPGGSKDEMAVRL